jgi:hypothetical protein
MAVGAALGHTAIRTAEIGEATGTEAKGGGNGFSLPPCCLSLRRGAVTRRMHWSLKMGKIGQA